jgi:hypothetical protein
MYEAHPIEHIIPKNGDNVLCDPPKKGAIRDGRCREEETVGEVIRQRGRWREGEAVEVIIR